MLSHCVEELANMLYCVPLSPIIADKDWSFVVIWIGFVQKLDRVGRPSIDRLLVIGGRANLLIRHSIVLLLAYRVFQLLD